ncbi:MAG: hypothetical protein P4L46_11140, partial [Fimbriimonas sp.]|nr:hypothetical protein [Fimbriimonas sp.]
MRSSLALRSCIWVGVFGAAALMSADAQSYWAYSDLHDFGGQIKNTTGKVGADGAGPWTNITFDTAGNMYGTAAYGGPNGRGLLWEITKAGAYIDLHDFGGAVTNANGTSGPDGETPYGGITFDSAGNMYGTTLFGGPYGNPAGYSGIVWELTKAGKYVDLHDFGGWTTIANGSGGPDGGNPCGGVAIDSSGNLYGTASAGGPYDQGMDGAGMVWEITKGGNYLDLHDFGGTVTNANGSQGADGYMTYAGVTLDSAGNLYGTTSKSGPYGGGVVWEITKAGGYVDLHDFGSTISTAGGPNGPDGMGSYGSVTLDGSGNLFGTTVSGGANGIGMIWELTTGGKYVDRHDFGGSVPTASGGQSRDGQFPYCGVSFDGSGNMYGTTAYGGANQWAGYSSGIVWEISKNGSYLDLHDFGGSVASASGSQAQDGTRPWYGVTLDPSGNLYGVAAYGGANGEGLSGGSGVVWALIQTPLQSLSIAPSAVLGGDKATGTITLGIAAPWNGLTIPLLSGSPNAIVPGTVKVASGATTGTFSVDTSPVDSSSTVTIYAGVGVAQRSATVTINPPTLSLLALNPVSIGGGGTGTGTVTLTGPAGPTGVSVTITSSSASAIVPSIAIVPTGKSSGTFTLTTQAVGVPTSAKITATLGGVQQSATISLTVASLAGVSASPSTLAGGNPCNGLVALTADAFTGGFQVVLSSSDLTVSVPKSVTVTAGSDSAAFAVTSKPVSTRKSVTIMAKSGLVSKTTVLTLVPPVLVSLAFSPAQISAGGTSTGTLTISGPAPASGMIVTLHSSSSKLTLPP